MRESAHPNSHDQELALGVAAMLREAQITAGDLSRLIVGRGPGSFTGLRIGFSFMKGLAQASGIPLSSVSSLGAAAFSLGAKDGGIIAAISDARGGEYFAGIYGFAEPGKMREIIAPRIFAPDALSRELHLLAKAQGVGPEAIKIVSLSNMPLTVAEFAVKKVSHLAESLIQVALFEEVHRNTSSAKAYVFAINEVAELSPEYVRQVSAKTIAERMGPKG